MNFIILGPQGCGKGTQAKLLAKKFGLSHISSGELLRREADSHSEKGKIIADLLTKGSLVPFETVLEVLEPALKAANTGFIIDGTPRDLRQAEHLDWFLNQIGQKIDRVIYLSLPREESIKRLQKRATIENRPDDTPESSARRLDIYEKETTPVIDYYRQKNLLTEIDGTPNIDTIHQDILQKIPTS
jgi:adenylate kinase